MKTFMRHLIGFVCCAGLLMGCSHLFYPKASALNDIRQGMSPKEVIRTLGNPDYKRINYDLEEWEYNKMLPDGNFEKKTAYEVSVGPLSVSEE